MGFFGTAGGCFPCDFGEPIEVDGVSFDRDEGISLGLLGGGIMPSDDLGSDEGFVFGIVASFAAIAGFATFPFVAIITSSIISSDNGGGRRRGETIGETIVWWSPRDACSDWTE